VACDDFSQMTKVVGGEVRSIDLVLTILLIVNLFLSMI